MSRDIQELCQRLGEISLEFAENEEAIEVLLARENAEDLLIAVALADAFVRGAVTLSEKAEEHLRLSEEELSGIIQEFQSEDGEE